MEPQRKCLSKVIFLNQPKLSEHLIDQKFNKLRIGFLPHIKDLKEAYYEDFYTGDINCNVNWSN